MAKRSVARVAQCRDLAFRDGLRKVDFVLVVKNDKPDLEVEMKRDKFLRVIGENGVEVEEEQYEIEEVSYRFIKLHAPWTLLAKTFGKEDNPSICASAAERSKAVYEELIQASAALECKSYARTILLF